MSVYIRGMEMPRACVFCELYDGDLYWCRGAKKEVPYSPEDKRAEFCPLVPVPEHGRLGDLDKLEQMFVDIDNAPYSGFDGSEPFYSAEDAAQIIRLSPTIIPKDKVV